MIASRSQSSSASSRYWVVRKIVVPSALMLRTSSQTVSREAGSRPVVGSSRKRTRGRWTSALARSSRRFIPPEIGLGAAVRRLGQPDQLEQLGGAPPAGRPLDPVQAALQLEQLASGLNRVEADLLERHADAVANCIAVGDHVMSGDRGAAAARRQQRAQHPHHGRLACAVRPEEAEDLSLGHAQIDLAHCLDAALEGAAQLARLDRRGYRIARHQLTYRLWEASGLIDRTPFSLYVPLTSSA